MFLVREIQYEADVIKFFLKVLLCVMVSENLIFFQTQCVDSEVIYVYITDGIVIM